MMRSEAITIIKRGLGFRQTQDNAIIAALKQAQRDAELGATLPNWLLVFDEPLVVTALAPNPTLPAGFLRIHEDYPLYYVNSDGAAVYLPRGRNDEMIPFEGVDTSSTPYPSVYTQQNKTTLKLMPTPTTSFSVYLTYYKAAELLDSEIENLWLRYAPNYLVGMAGVHVAGDLRDQGAMQKFNLMATAGRRTLMNDIVEDELAGRPLIMGRNN